MRFIIGLLIGAAATLIIATALQSDQPVWQTSLAKLQSWHGGITRNITEPGAPAVLDNAEEVAIEKLDTLPPAQPYPAIDLTGEPPLPDRQPQEQLATRLDPARPPATQQVWTPFYSEASARGFAAQLSNTLQRSFAVQKKAAAQYVIVFNSDSAEETATVHTQIADLFGEAGQP